MTYMYDIKQLETQAKLQPFTFGAFFESPCIINSKVHRFIKHSSAKGSDKAHFQ